MYRQMLILAIVCSAVSPAWAALQPEEVAVIAVRGSAQSEELAKYYIQARGLPEGNLCLVDMPKGEVCPRDQWTWAIRPEIRKWIDEHDPQRKLRCLVTVWDVPLKVGPSSSDPAQARYRTFLEGERRSRLELLDKIAQQLNQIAPNVKIPSLPAPGSPGGATGAATPDEAAATVAAAANKSELATRQANLEQTLQAAQARLAKLPTTERGNAPAQLQQLATLAGGARVLLQGMERQLNQPPEDPPQLQRQFDLLRGRASAFIEMKVILDQLPPSYHRDALVLAALERNGGLLATIEWLDEQLATVGKNETGASFDSELALVMWDDYELLRWQPNYLRAAYDNSQLRDAYRTLMVARLDAPTFELAKGLVDKAIAAEKDGLKGKAYIDGRGMATGEETAAAQPGSFADFDRALMQLAKALKDLTTIEVVVNSTPDLFKAGACPDAALYCGWYSLGKYVDAFEWAPGAIGVHLASSEAATLHDPGSQVWCKRMLEDGVTATMGPVYEPYLAAFPRPEDFFGLLVQGELTLAECYWRSQPFTSWMMTLIGDPLYQPFKNHPVIDKDKVAAMAAAAAAGPANPPAPAEPAPPAPPAEAEAQPADNEPPAPAEPAAQ